MNLLHLSRSLASAVRGCLELGVMAGLHCWSDLCCLQKQQQKSSSSFSPVACCRNLQKGSELVGIPVQEAGCRKELVHV